MEMFKKIIFCCAMLCTLLIAQSSYAYSFTWKDSSGKQQGNYVWVRIFNRDDAVTLIPKQSLRVYPNTTVTYEGHEPLWVRINYVVWCDDWWHGTFTSYLNDGQNVICEVTGNGYEDFKCSVS